MKSEISLGILDLAENSLRAGASLIEISIDVSSFEGSLNVSVRDNGCGMTAEQLEKAVDPFFTTKETEGSGLGLPFLKDSAECTGGTFQIESVKGKGTCVKAVFGLFHINRMPLGDIGATVRAVMVLCSDVVFSFSADGKGFVMDTRAIRKILGGVSLDSAPIMEYIKEYLEENIQEASGEIKL